MNGLFPFSSAKPGISRWIALTVLAMLGGCASMRSGLKVGPDYQEPEIEVPENFRYGTHVNGRSPAARDEWWTLFGDRELDQLIQRVRAENRELRAGLRRIEQARAIARVSRSEALPRVGAAPSFDRSRSSEEAIGGTFAPGTHNLFSLPVTLDWELDLFGRIRRGYEAAVADSQAAEEDLNDLRLLLETEAATLYFTIRTLDREIEIVERGVTSQRDAVNLVKHRFEIGVVSDLDFAQAQTQLALSEADLSSLKRQRSAQENALAVLTGQAASQFSVAARGLSGTPPKIPSGIPSELLRARPDIRRTERTLAAENARIGVATAAFYPSLSISGNLGLQAAETSDLFTGGARFWGINPQIYIPLFQGVRNRANLARSQARYEEVLEAYQQAILSGIAEVETALAAWKHLETERAARQRAVETAKRARDLSLRQYEGGTVNYLNVLDAERTALDTERHHAQLAGSEFLNAITLLRALGGRW